MKYINVAQWDKLNDAFKKHIAFGQKCVCVWGGGSYKKMSPTWLPKDTNNALKLKQKNCNTFKLYVETQIMMRIRKLEWNSNISVGNNFQD